MFYIIGKFKTRYILCDLLSLWKREIMFWHLFSVLLKTLLGPAPWKLLLGKESLCPCSRRCPQPVAPEGTLFFRNKTLSSQRAAAELCCCKVWAAESCMRKLYIEQGIFQGTGCQRAASICLFPSPVSVCVCRRKGASGMFTAPDCWQWCCRSTWTATGHFTYYKHLKTQAQELFRPRTPYHLHQCSPDKAIKLYSFHINPSICYWQMLGIF